MWFAPAKGLISIEAIFALLACVLIISATLTDATRNYTLLHVYEYQLLNDFLAMMSEHKLDGEFVAQSGFCLKLGTDDDEFLPYECIDSVPRDAVSASRVFVGEEFTWITASLWKK